MPTVQIVAYDPTTTEAAARSGTMRTPYNESGEHLEDEDDDDDDETLTDPDETGIDLLEETTRLEEEEENNQRDDHGDEMEVDGGSNNNRNPTPQRPSNSNSNKLSKEQKQQLMAALMDCSDDESDAYFEIYARKKLAKEQKLQQQQQQQQQQPSRLRVNHQDLSADASHDTKVIANTSSTPPTLPPTKQSDNYSFNDTQPWERELRAVENLENNASPTPVPNRRRTTIDKVDTTFLDSSQWQLPSQLPSQLPPSQLPSQLTQSSEWRRQSNSNTPNNNRSSLQQTDKETWQEEAFRSSLVDLLKTVPSSYFFTSKDLTMRDDFWLGKCGGGGDDANNTTTNDESQDSITSQQVASAQLQRQRCFDAAARSLARLAIASRYIRPKNGKNSKNSSNSNRSDDMEEESPPDCSPPTPRTLPAFMSVLNVIDSAENSGFWGSDVNSMMVRNSKDVFCGQSAHGRNARTVFLPNDNIDCNTTTTKRNTRSKSSNPFESWTLEQMAIGVMKVAAQVCHEAAIDSNFDRNRPENEVPSCRVAGFVVQNSAAKDQHETKHSALVESSLEFLATAFACLESDVVYAVLRSPLQSHDASNVLVLDAITYFAPSAATGMNNSSSQNASTIPMLALLTLSRGFDAAHFVTRYATSLDPSSICATYTSPHSLGEEGYIGQKQNINFGVDEGGVGYLSAAGRDLGLSIDSNEERSRLIQCAEYAYDCILDFDPIIVDDGESLYSSSGHAMGNRQKSHNSFRLGLKVDTQVGQNMASAYRRPSVVKDRIFSSAVEYLSSMVHFGIVSAWLSPTSMDEEHADVRTVDKLCQKLYSVIETRARIRRSTNQSTKNECDNEAVCASALSLLILILPRHVEQPLRTTSLSTSFRNMGDETTANISDVLQSSMVKKIVDLALSWEDVAKESNNQYANHCASNNAILILSTILMAGAGALVEENAAEQLKTFLQRVAESICNRGEAEGDEDDQYVASSLLLLFHLHSDCPILVRQFLRDYIGSNDDVATGASFTAGLIHLCTTKSFAVASCASSLLRTLIGDSPIDRTEDVLSELILSSLDSEIVFDAMDAVFYTIHQTAGTSVQNKEHLPGLECVRWHPRLCLLSDMMDKCSSSINFYRCIQVSLNVDDADITDLFVQFLAPGRSRDHVHIDTLTNSTDMSLLMLFARFAVKSLPFQDHDTRASFSAMQKDATDKLLGPNAFATIEASMLQGSSIDLMHRSLTLQNLMLSLHSNERHRARSLTRLTSSVRRREEETRARLARSEQELTQLSSRYKQMELDRDSLTNALHDQRSSYERKLDLVRAEVQMKARTTSKVHAQERKLAEERLLAEQDSKLSTERDNERISKANEQLKREISRDKLRIQELEEMFAEERKSKQLSESELEKCTTELSSASEEMKQMTTTAQEMQLKLAASEESVSNLTAIRKDSEAKLEDTCEHLIKLVDIYQSKEAEMNKTKKKIRIAYDERSQETDIAQKRYEKETRRNQALTKELDEVKTELDEVKTNKAQQHRMRTNAPVAYLNSMHNQRNNDTRPKQKPQGRSRRGKENALDRE